MVDEAVLNDIKVYRKKGIIMNTENQKRIDGVVGLPGKAYCYACLSEKCPYISEGQLKRFAVATVPGANIRVEKAFIDTNPDVAISRRPQWRAALKECAADGVKVIILPSLSMLSEHISDATQMIRTAKEKYDVNLYFLLEDIYTGEENAEAKLSYHAVIRECIYYRKQQKKKLNAIFDEVKNEPDDGLVEVSFEIDQEVFEQAKKICDDMGTTIEAVLVAFLKFCIVPENLPRVKEILGIEDDGESKT